MNMQKPNLGKRMLQSLDLVEVYATTIADIGLIIAH